MNIPQDVANVIVDPNAYADRRRIDEAFTWVRQNAPFAVAQPDGYDPFWVVSRHADIQEVERRSDEFLNTGRPVACNSRETIRKMEAAGLAGAGVLLNQDGPVHAKFRRITQGALSPGALRAREERLREVARHFVDQLQEKGERCDFVRDLALLYPLHVIMDTMGVPEADEPLMLKLTQELAASTDPELNRTGSGDGELDVSAAMATIAQLFGYFQAITEDRRANPRDDLATVIASGRIDDRPLEPFETMGYYGIVATAGHDTTSSSVGHGMWALAENPEQFAKVKADPNLIAGLVDESIRWASPVKHFMRTAGVDAEVAGQKISKGDWLMMCYASGNRDETVFDDPFEFRVDRSPNPHVAFGFGPHVCLGMHLAKLEMRILWQELLPRLKSVELDGTPKLTVSRQLVGPKALPLRLEFA